MRKPLQQISNTQALVVIFSSLMLVLASCQTPQQQGRDDVEKVDVKVAKSVYIPKEDNGVPVTGLVEAKNPDRIITLSSVGEKFQVKNGETVNFIYDGIDPETTYIIYESTEEGYNLQLAYRRDPVVVKFKTMCQSYIVATPSLTNIDIPSDLKYEQIIWTPREDGTWECRIGTVERGCKSKSLQDLQKLRSKDYEKNIPKKK